MARLFVSPREIDLINDLAKEVIKDVVGHKIYYYAINELRTNVHPVYEESPEKMFDTPIELDVLIEFFPQDPKTGRFGHEEFSQIKAYVQSRDLIDKGINLSEGDFFSYGDMFFEVTSLKTMRKIYGQVEFDDGIEIVGREARKGQFNAKIFGPTSEEYTDDDAIQKTFVQQRGLERNRLGVTEDVRSLQKKGVLEPPISGPQEVSSRGGGDDSSSFYDE